MRAKLLLLAVLVFSIPPVFSAAPRPNVLIFIADDVSWNDYGCYGNPDARTPNIDRLAETGMRFTQAVLTASSCSPSRASIITGRYPHNNGKAAELHLPIAAHLPWIPHALKEAGYYTALAGKNHMTPEKPAPGEKALPSPWDEVRGTAVPGNTGGHGHWVDVVQKRPKNQPFFFWFASTDAHRDWDGDKQWKPELYGPRHQPDQVIVPPFLIDDEATRADLASYYNEVTRFDYYIGEVIKELKTQGILDQTLIFVLADNGRPFPRAKTRLHDSGMKTALVAHWPQGIGRSARVCESLVSAIDLAPTILEAAGVSAPPTMQGVSLLPLFENEKRVVRQYAFSEHNWHDYEAHGRAVRSEGFMFLHNARPEQAWQGPADSVRSPSHQSLLQSAAAGTALTPAQQDVLLAPRPETELYDLVADPDQLNNLAEAPAWQSKRKHLEEILNQWVQVTNDSVPREISKDQFDRRTGKIITKDYRRTTPGEDRDAAHQNAPGPR